MVENFIDRFLITEKGEELLSSGDKITGSFYSEEDGYLKIDLASPGQENPVARRWFFEAFGSKQSNRGDERRVFEYKGMSWLNPSYTLKFYRELDLFCIDATKRDYVTFQIIMGSSVGNYVFQACYSLEPSIQEVGEIGDLGSLTFSSPLHRGDNLDDGLKEYIIDKPNGKIFRLGTNAEYRLQRDAEGSNLKFVTQDPDDKRIASALVVEHIDIISLHEMIKSEEFTWRNIVGRFPISAQLCLDKVDQ